MRFMMFMYPGIKEEDWGAGSPEDFAAMGRYNEELRKAGMLLSLDGLQPPVEGARVTFAGGKPSVTDGPFAEAKEVVGGYWVIQARSKEEAVEWASRCPAGENDFIEVRRVFEMEDFPQDVQDAYGEADPEGVAGAGS
ncbi:MAG TPA: YciI family protein [Solirubrobacterales bacterium]|nr:YciI family protein [Solirubrobacterales bacterium]